MVKKISASVDHDICIGNAMCTSIAPNAFTLSDDRRSVPTTPNADSVEQIIEAAENCPVAAISITYTDTGQKLFP